MKGAEPFWKEGGGGPVAGARGVRVRRHSRRALWVSAAAALNAPRDWSPWPLIRTHRNAIAPQRWGDSRSEL